MKMENKFADLALECKYKWVPLVDTCPAMDPILIIGTRVLLVGLSNSDTAVWISIEFDPC